MGAGRLEERKAEGGNGYKSDKCEQYGSQNGNLINIGGDNGKHQGRVIEQADRIRTQLGKGDPMGEMCGWNKEEGNKVGGLEADQGEREISGENTRGKGYP